MRRMDRYKDEDTTEVSRRSSKNQELYQTIGTNTRYTNFTDVSNANAYDISIQGNPSTREGYQKMRQYNNVYDYAPKERKELDDYNKLISSNEHKVYDINSVLENARKNKEEVDILDEKRKLKNNSYNILSAANKKELEEYRKERQERIKKDQEAEIKNIIDKTMAGEINKETTVDLLSDLMATNIMDAIEKPEKEEYEDIELDAVDKLMLEEEKKKQKEKETTEEQEEKKKQEDNSEVSKEVLNKEQLEEVIKIKEKNKEEQDNLMEKADKDFYTRSMDLSEEDFMSEEFKDDKLPLWVKLLILILMIAIAIVAGYFIHQNM